VNRTLANRFAADVEAWARTEDEDALICALRSRYSGVPNDAGAAYAIVAERSGSLLDSIARDRLALSPDDRERVFTFVRRLRAVRAGAKPEAVFDLEAAPPAGAPRGDAFELAEPALPEPQSAVRARMPSHFSASALNTYAECARKWYYRYVCAAIEDAPSSASIYGTAFHAALEDFHGEFPRPSSELEASMRAKLERYVHFAFERFRDDFSTEVEARLQERRAQRTAKRYVDWLLAEARHSPFTVIGRELPANLGLDGFEFVGFIDRLDRDDATGRVSIFDYKTGTIAESAAEYLEKVRKFRDFQLPFYYWARTAAGDRVARLALIPLKDALVDVRPISLAVGETIAVADLDRARKRMVELCRELTSAELRHFPATTDPSACTYCAYVTACIDRPHGERERFGR
jgi:RecB family exonuclease